MQLRCGGSTSQKRDSNVLIQSKMDSKFNNRLHPCQVPEIIALPIQMGLQSYLDWIDEVTTTAERAPFWRVC
jgi:uncharacterized protein involved in tolerance to divalent cations